ncbi:MAG: ribbon-helix-helix protein, CopG family [Nitrospinae bacterium]|nr:ribbon-helix-helix protein, CopG family [Nitrospinota bacterium]
MVRTQIQLTEKQAAAIKNLAKKKHTSMAELIRRSIDNMARMGVVDEERRQRAMEAAGKFHSGVSDLSGKHDKYLIEAFK